MKVVPELVETSKKLLAERNQHGEVGTMRVDVCHEEQKRLSAVVKHGKEEFTFCMDEPAIRGGTAKGPWPLAYFLAGAGG